MDKRETLVKLKRPNPWVALKVLGYLLVTGTVLFTVEYWFVYLVLKTLDGIASLLR